MKKISTDSSTYYNARDQWLSENDWRTFYKHEEFSRWLKTQGGVINESRRENHMIYVMDSIRIAPGIDTIDFDDEQKAVWFTLQWS